MSPSDARPPDVEAGAKIVDHLFRHGGGFADYGRPTFRAFCGQCAATGRGSHTADEHDPEGFGQYERVRDAAPDLLEALEALASVDAEWQLCWCPWAAGHPKHTASCEKARAAIAAARPPAPDAAGGRQK